MTNPKIHGTVPFDPDGGLAALRGEAGRMAPHWAAPAKVSTAPVSPSLIHGVTVPSTSARLVDAMPEYGD